MSLASSSLKSFAMLAIAWSVASPAEARKWGKAPVYDTIPGKGSTGQSSDIDQQLQQLDKALDKLNSQLSEKNFNKIQEKLEESVSKIDMAAIQQQIDQAIKQIDFKKIQLEATAALKKIDLEKIQQDIRSALKEASDKTNTKALNKEMEEAVKEAKKAMEAAKNIDFDKIKKEIDRARDEWQKEKVNMEKELQEAKSALNNNKVNIQAELLKAKEELIQSRDALHDYKTLIDKMENAGLLNTSENYSIDYKAGELYINEKKQSQEITDRYKAYFRKDDIHIKKTDGKFTTSP